MSFFYISKIISFKIKLDLTWVVGCTPRNILFFYSTITNNTLTHKTFRANVSTKIGAGYFGIFVCLSYVYIICHFNLTSYLFLSVMWFYVMLYKNFRPQPGHSRGTLPSPPSNDAPEMAFWPLLWISFSLCEITNTAKHNMFCWNWRHVQIDFCVIQTNENTNCKSAGKITACKVFCKEYCFHISVGKITACKVYCSRLRSRVPCALPQSILKYSTWSHMWVSSEALPV